MMMKQVHERTEQQNQVGQCPPKVVEMLTRHGEGADCREHNQGNADPAFPEGWFRSTVLMSVLHGSNLV